MNKNDLIAEIRNSIVPSPRFEDTEYNYRKLLTTLRFFEDLMAHAESHVKDAEIAFNSIIYAAEKAGNQSIIRLPRSAISGLSELLTKQRDVVSAEYQEGFYITELTELKEKNLGINQRNIEERYKKLEANYTYAYQIRDAIVRLLESSIIKMEQLKEIQEDSQTAMITQEDYTVIAEMMKQQRSLANIFHSLIHEGSPEYIPTELQAYNTIEHALDMVESKVKKAGYNLHRKYTGRFKSIYFVGDAPRTNVFVDSIIDNALHVMKNANQERGNIYADMEVLDGDHLGIQLMNDGPPIDISLLSIPSTDILNKDWSEIKGTGLMTCTDIIERQFKGLLIPTTIDGLVAFEAILPIVDFHSISKKTYPYQLHYQ